MREGPGERGEARKTTEPSRDEGARVRRALRADRALHHPELSPPLDGTMVR